MHAATERKADAGYDRRMNLYFPSEDAAETALTAAGFALGELQRDSPRGIMFGTEWLVMKWRNLSRADRLALHGVYQRQYRDGPVTITLSALCPKAGAEALRLAEEVARDEAATRRAHEMNAELPAETLAMLNLKGMA